MSLHFHQSLADGVEDGLGAVVDVELGKDVGDVVLHRLLSDGKLTSDLFVAVTLANEGEHLSFSLG
jgi:hypothetical protein